MLVKAITQKSIDKIARYLIWAKPEYIEFLKSDKLIQHNELSTYTIETDPKDYKEDSIYDAIEKLFMDAGFSEENVWNLKLGVAELLVNAAKHVYGFEKLSPDGSKNFISLDVLNTPYYVDVGAITKYAPVDISRVKEKMITGSKISLRDSGRGFTLMNMFFDACYVNHCYLNGDKNLAPYSAIGLIKLKDSH